MTTAATTGNTTTGEPGFEELAQAIDDALKAAGELDGKAREASEKVRESLEAAHRAALVTIVRTLRADDRGRELLYELVDDPLIHLLFARHEIIRPDPLTAARSALERVRPGIRSHGGDVELDSIEDGVAYVRLSGACQGCSLSAVTMRETVEKALVADVPAVTSVEVLPNEPAQTVIPLSAVRPRDQSDQELREAGWARAGSEDEVAEGEVKTVRLQPDSGRAEDVVLVRVGTGLAAYRNECAHQGLPLDDAMIDPVAGTLTCPWHGFCYDAMSGECMTAIGATLEQRPLRVIGGEVWVRAEA